MTRTRLRVAQVLIFASALVGLWQVVPGFRPKQIRDFVLYFMTTERGLGDAAYFGVMALLLPAAYRLKRYGVAITTISGLFVILSGLLAIDLFFELVLRNHVLARGVFRAAYIVVAAWGLADRRMFHDLVDGTVRSLSMLWRSVGGAGWKALAVVVVFFLFREALHFHTTRASPSGDEIFWWFTGSKIMMNQGMGEILVTRADIPRGYTPGLPWLISFPARVLGAHREQWLFGFTLFVTACFVWLVLELSRTGKAALAGLAAIFCMFAADRDFRALIGGSLYGEAVAGLLTALFLIEIYRRWFGVKALGASGAERRRALVGSGLLVLICALSKPPLAYLAVVSAFLMIASTIVFTPGLADKFKSGVAIAASALGGYSFYSLGMKIVGLAPEYKWSLEKIQDAGFHPFIPLQMLLGCFVPGTFQFAFTLGLLIALAYVVLARAWRLLAVMTVGLATQWGFVFSLYATLWAAGDWGSAGRYLAHAAIACVLMLPLAFSEKNAS